jgi:hypothetical protein
MRRLIGFFIDGRLCAYSNPASPYWKVAASYGRSKMMEISVSGKFM